MNNRAFTLIEIIIAVVLISILASVALPRYVRVVEKSRSAEARNILGRIRSAQSAYMFEYDHYPSSSDILQIPVPTACNASYYFSYAIVNGSGTFTATANRCTGGAGKSPSGLVPFSISINENGTLSGTQGYL